MNSQKKRDKFVLTDQTLQGLGKIFVTKDGGGVGYHNVLSKENASSDILLYLASVCASYLHSRQTCSVSSLCDAACLDARRDAARDASRVNRAHCDGAIQIWDTEGRFAEQGDA